MAFPPRLGSLVFEVSLEFTDGLSLRFGWRRACLVLLKRSCLGQLAVVGSEHPAYLIVLLHPLVEKRRFPIQRVFFAGHLPRDHLVNQERRCILAHLRNLFDSESIPNLDYILSEMLAMPWTEVEGQTVTHVKENLREHFYGVSGSRILLKNAEVLLVMIMNVEQGVI